MQTEDNSSLDFYKYQSEDAVPYRTTGHLGRGGYATVYKVIDRRNPSRVLACKTLKIPELRTTQLELPCDFLNEISTMKRLSSHPHVVKFVDAYLVDDAYLGKQWCIIQEPVADSGDLRVLLQRCRENTEPLHSRVFSILVKAFRSLASALTYVHKSSVRHKDIAPSNILVHQGDVLLSDFGSAFPFIEGYSASSGIPAPAHDKYTAPEVKNKSKRGTSADVWSLGCVFFEILTVLNTAALDGPCSKVHSQTFRDRDKYSLVTGLLSSMIQKLGESSLMENIIIRGFSPAPEAPRKIYFQVPKAYYASTLSMMTWKPSERPNATEVWCNLCQCAPHDWQAGKCRRNVSKIGLPDCKICTPSQTFPQSPNRMYDESHFQFHAYSPLCYAARNNWYNVAQLLSDDEVVELETTDQVGGQSSFTKVQNRHDDVIELLKEYRSKFDDDVEKLRRVARAIQDRQWRMVRTIIDKMDNLDQKTTGGNTVLHLVVQSFVETVAIEIELEKCQEKEIIKLLLHRKADCNLGNNRGRTVLHVAVARRSLPVTRMLLQHRPDIEARDDEGMTALHLASRSGEKEFSKLLLEHGAEVNARDNDECTPLHIAAVYSRRHAAVPVLLDWGADMEAKDKNELTALQRAFYIQAEESDLGLTFEEIRNCPWKPRNGIGDILARWNESRNSRNKDAEQKPEEIAYWITRATQDGTRQIIDAVVDQSDV